MLSLRVSLSTRSFDSDTLTSLRVPEKRERAPKKKSFSRASSRVRAPFLFSL